LYEFTNMNLEKLQATEAMADLLRIEKLAQWSLMIIIPPN